MPSQFRLIKINDPESLHIFPLIHNLRKRVFCDDLGWETGLYNVNLMEFDDYDYKNPEAHYIVRVNDAGGVDAMCRLMPTSGPYMLGECYPQFVTYQNLPASDRVWEISRLCTNPDAPPEIKGQTAGYMFAAAFEFGLTKNMTSLVSLTTASLLPKFTAKGLSPRKLGPRGLTPNDISYALSYAVNFKNLEKIRKTNMIAAPLLFDVNADSLVQAQLSRPANDNQANKILQKRTP